MERAIGEQVRALFDALVDVPEEDAERRARALCGDAVVVTEVLELLQLDRRLRRSEPVATRGASLPILLPGAHVGRFELVEPVAAGGTADIWRARTAEGHDVAVKFVRPDLSPSGRAHALDSLRREAECLGQLETAGFPRLLAAALDHPTCAHLVSSWVAGEPLDRAALQRSGRSGIDGLLELCDLTAQVHAAGYAHGDLKPANVVVTSGGALVLLDFGNAWPLDDARRASSIGPAGATAEWSAPEVRAGGAPSAAADVFALARIGQLLLSEMPPTAERSTTESLRRCLSGALAHDALARPRDARALAQELRTELALADRLHTRRRRSVVLAAVAATAVAGAGILWLRHAERRAERSELLEALVNVLGDPPAREDLLALTDRGSVVHARALALAAASAIDRGRAELASELLRTGGTIVARATADGGVEEPVARAAFELAVQNLRIGNTAAVAVALELGRSDGAAIDAASLTALEGIAGAIDGDPATALASLESAVHELPPDSPLRAPSQRAWLLARAEYGPLEEIDTPPPTADGAPVDDLFAGLARAMLAARIGATADLQDAAAVLAAVAGDPALDIELGRVALWCRIDPQRAVAAAQHAQWMPATVHAAARLAAARALPMDAAARAEHLEAAGALLLGSVSHSARHAQLACDLAELLLESEPDLHIRLRRTIPALRTAAERWSDGSALAERLAEVLARSLVAVGEPSNAAELLEPASRRLGVVAARARLLRALLASPETQSAARGELDELLDRLIAPSDVVGVALHRWLTAAVGSEDALPHAEALLRVADSALHPARPDHVRAVRGLADLPRPLAFALHETRGVAECAVATTTRRHASGEDTSVEFDAWLCQELVDLQFDPLLAQVRPHISQMASPEAQSIAEVLEALASLGDADPQAGAAAALAALQGLDSVEEVAHRIVVRAAVRVQRTQGDAAARPWWALAVRHDHPR